VDGRERAPFPQAPGMETPPFAEETAREVALEVKRLMTDAHNVALSILRERRTALSEIMRRLLDREVVEGEVVRGVLAGAPPAGAHAA
jgi:cell division protease FtsH